MFNRLLRNKKGQNTAEYAILISLVVAGIIAMQTYAQRALQSRVRDAGTYLADQTSDLGSTIQYEPYYLDTNYTVERDESDTQVLDTNVVTQTTNSDRIRRVGGTQTSQYDTSLGVELGI